MEILLDYLEEDSRNVFIDLTPQTLSSSPEECSASYLPGFVKPICTTIGDEKYEHLLLQGALTLPSFPLQQALLQTFFECVLPSMPIINWQTFINIVSNKEGGQGQISLLLFQAIMFSATAFVNLDHLQKAGYSSREEAHEAFFQKAHLLYQSHYEPDPLANLQALLLMTHRAKAADGKDSRYWIEVAISLALIMGLFRNLPSGYVGHHNQKLHRRIAWTCYMADSFIALRLRCLPLIRSVDFNLSMLTEDDFDFGHIPMESQLLLPGCTFIRRREVQRYLADICVSQAQLSLCIRRVLNVQARYNSAELSSETTAKTPDTQNKHHSDYLTSIWMSQKALADWEYCLPPICQRPPTVFGIGSNESTIVTLHRNVLHMVYHGVVCVLYQSRIFQSSSSRMQHAATQITEIATELDQMNVLHSLPIICSTTILIAMIIHLAEVQTSSPMKQGVTMRDIQSCIELMKRLQDVHSSMDIVSHLILTALEKCSPS
ncbi:fungal-specific transcription factor domain-containing protein [Aspergillus pseudocaelatus]|uniref:Fungal-specific transcription factor domain-containing protein n=1 Tax=Aspergillus pseudocaelatus TaxID=1825620 RepID=A0ABQ6W307_9EURO|nr:fungal-specific transcription factor domain-containing protein [Aspergillus pseudocaelatus]